MRFHDANRPADDDIAALIERAELARLITVDGAGVPQVGLFPFVVDGSTVHLHLHQADEQVADLQARPACAISIDEPLAITPSHWLDPHNAKLATGLHRSVTLECTAAVSTDPAAVAASLNRIMQRYQPEGDYDPVDADDPLYAAPVRTLVAVELAVGRTRAKFKLHQDRPPEIIETVARQLEARGRPRDGAAAAALRSGR